MFANTARRFVFCRPRTWSSCAAIFTEPVTCIPQRTAVHEHLKHRIHLSSKPRIQRGPRVGAARRIRAHRRPVECDSPFIVLCTIGCAHPPNAAEGSMQRSGRRGAEAFRRSMVSRDIACHGMVSHATGPATCRLEHLPWGEHGKEQRDRFRRTVPLHSQPSAPFPNSARSQS